MKRYITAILATMAFVLAATSGIASATYIGDASNAYALRDYYAVDAAHPYYKTQDNLYIEKTTERQCCGGVGIGLFYIDDFSFVGDSGFGGYAGIQTEVQNPNNGGQFEGRGFVASVWNSTGVYSTTPGVYSYHGVENGQPYYSLHIKLDWSEGHWYRINVERLTSGCSCVHVTFNDLYTGGYLDIGYFYIPISWTSFHPEGDKAPKWTEEYYPNAYNCPMVQISSAIWGTSIMSRIGASDLYPYQTRPFVDHIAGSCGNSYVDDLGGGNGDMWRERIGG